jgi:hypothetical protein
MTEHELSPDHERVAREATERIRAGVVKPAPADTARPPEGAFEDETTS